jgi:hypothetical protein
MLICSSLPLCMMMETLYPRGVVQPVEQILLRRPKNLDTQEHLG